MGFIASNGTEGIRIRDDNRVSLWRRRLTDDAKTVKCPSRVPPEVKRYRVVWVFGNGSCARKTKIKKGFFFNAKFK